MKIALVSLLLIFVFSNSYFSQNVGVGTITPTNSLHVVPVGGTEPLRVEGMQSYQLNDTSLYITNPATGVVRTISLANLSSVLNISNLDSLIFSHSDSLYTIISDSLLKDSLWIHQLDSMLSIYGDTIYFNDTSYTLIRDSLLNDSLFLDSLISLIGDSIDTDIDKYDFYKRYTIPL